MKFLVDTNVMVRLHDVADVQHAIAADAIERLEEQGHECCIVPQVFYEYWVVATRPADRNGLGVTVAEAASAIADWTTVFRLLLDERGIYSRWRPLVIVHEVKGKNAHDARLVAAMQRHGLTHLLTFNKPDFARFPAINVFTPKEIVSGKLLESGSTSSSHSGTFDAGQ